MRMWRRWLVMLLSTLLSSRHTSFSPLPSITRRQISISDGVSSGNICDGMLVSICRRSEAIVPGRKLYKTLYVLSADRSNRVVVSNGRDRAPLDQWFGRLAVSLAAEHGAFYKECRGGWQGRGGQVGRIFQRFEGPPSAASGALRLHSRNRRRHDRRRHVPGPAPGGRHGESRRRFGICPLQSAAAGRRTAAAHDVRPKRPYRRIGPRHVRTRGGADRLESREEPADQQEKRR